MDLEAKRAKEQMKALPLKERMKNYWFYYKWHVVAGIAVLAMIAVTVVQVATRVDYDLNVACYSVAYMNEEKIDAFADFLEEHIEDTNENESKDVGIAVNVADITGETMDQMAQAIMTKFSAELAAGTNGAFIADETYKNLLDKYEGMVETVVEISSIPELKEALGVADGQKLYWLTMAVTEALDNDKDFAKQHKNAKLIEDYLKNLIK